VTIAATPHSFAGSIPEFYDRYLGPAWMDAFAEDLAQRLPEHPEGDVLELACGTGLVTKWLRRRLDPALRLVATDLSEPMLAYAQRKYAEVPGVEWRVADATQLPFGDAEFGAAACGFGVMFVPQPVDAMREARRVLKKGGVFCFTVWDRIENNPTGLANAETIEGLIPGDPELRFRLPIEMHDAELLRRLLREGGFREKRIEPKQVAIESASVRDLAIGVIRGTPRSQLLEKKGAKLDEVIEKVAAALVRIGGDRPYRSKANAIVVEAIAA